MYAVCCNKSPCHILSEGSYFNISVISNVGLSLEYEKGYLSNYTMCLFLAIAFLGLGKDKDA